jgi:APA family basic amino acid/polyamine antiporter
LNATRDPSTPGRGELGFWMSTALVIGNVIGMGIFMQPASLAPYGFNAFVAWAITVIGCAALALVFAMLARRLPQADGPFGYMRQTLGEGVSFAALWCYWVSVWVTNAALAVAVTGYLVAAMPPLAVLPPAAVSIGMVWLFVAVNLLGTRTGGGVQVLTTVLKLLPLALVMLLGLRLLFTEPAAYSASLPTTPLSLPGTLAASTIALFAMLGLESAAIPAGKVRDPGRTIPRATLVGTLLTATIYIAVTAIALLLVPQETLSRSDAPFVVVLDRLAGVGFGRWLALFVVISGLGALNGWTLLVGELTRTLALHGLLPAVVARNNSRGAPGVALALTGALATAVALMNYSRSLVDGFTFLSVVVTAANLPLYLCCAAAILVLWRRAPDLLPRGAWVLGLGGVVYSVFAFIGVGGEAFLWALVLTLAGLPLYGLRRLRHRPAPSGTAPRHPSP